MTDYNIILGIDPSSVFTGYGVLDKGGYVDVGLLKLGKKPMGQRLKEIFCSLDQVIKQYKITEVAMEGGFLGKNVSIAIKLGQARAAVILAAEINNLPVYQYSPREIKLAVVGYGAAEKDQVAFMVKQILKVDVKCSEHETDALATCICHFNSSRIPEFKKKYLLK